MSKRPTPEQIASTRKGGVKVLRDLVARGYVIVHPDDVDIDDGDAFARGWNACRAHIFGRQP